MALGAGAKSRTHVKMMIDVDGQNGLAYDLRRSPGLLIARLIPNNNDLSQTED